MGSRTRHGPLCVIMDKRSAVAGETTKVRQW